MVRAWSAWSLVGLAACGRLDFALIGPSDAVGSGDHGPAVDARAGSDAAEGSGSLTFIQNTATTGQAATLAATFEQSVASGDLLVIGVDFANPGGPAPNLTSLTDSLGDIYTLVGPYDGDANGNTPTRLYIGIATSVANGVTTVTATLDAAPVDFIQLRIHEYAGAAASPLDAWVGAAGATTGADGAVATITTTEPRDLIFAMVLAGSVSAGTGFTMRGGDFGDVTEDELAIAPGAYQVLASPSDSWALLAVALAAE